MCRVMAIAGLKPDKNKLLWKFLITAAPLMTTNNDDGLGYAAIGKDGLWGERWRYPFEAWRPESRKLYDGKDEAVLKKFKDAVDPDLRYSCFGEQGGDTKAVIYHARASTNDKTLANVHPFVREKTALIHNGVIRNDNQLKKITSTCDSECILNEYVDESVADDVDKIVSVTKKLYGYYGCAVLTENKKGSQYLDIFRHTASLSMAWIDQLQAAVICTSEEVIKDVCKELKLTYGHIFRIKENTLIRLDVNTGQPIAHRKFEPCTVWPTSHASSSGESANAGKTSMIPLAGAEESEAGKKNDSPTQEESEMLRTLKSS